MNNCKTIDVTDEMMEVGARLLIEWERDDLGDMSSKDVARLLFLRMLEISPSMDELSPP